MTTPSRSWLVGGYGPDGGGDSRGIVRLRTEPDGTLAVEALLVETPSPSFLLVDGEAVVAVAEGRGTVDAFSRGPRGGLRPLWSASSGGTAPCALARWGPVLAVADYGDGALGIVADGRLRQVLPGEGSGPGPGQDGPHAHAVLPLDAATMLSLDLGADRVHVHERSGIDVSRTGSVRLPAGTGPRDLLRHPGGALLVLGELSCELLVLEDGVVTAVVPLPGAEPGDHAAGLALGAGGRFLYTALRGSDRIAVVELPAGGAPRAVGWVPSNGSGPRHLVVDGPLLHVANLRSSGVASFRLGVDGRPSPLGRPTPVASPSYLVAESR
ncbi:lactonase family protein [Rathayibacter sp. Leaf296]|uniref:lactonase family protein n=1 Tax=Rathayibacter sp. Leaf296 TaxID=1736327 RepID=UPI000702C165|nr:beta-propeller fold lactonase family protein [Rathayibacter sp. Leaf296]KQQ08262.1 hypothetical protein ASF46_13110 [Rathayibacter sp. Leaf296]